MRRLDLFAKAPVEGRGTASRTDAVALAPKTLVKRILVDERHASPDQRALKRIAQFADVARPGQGRELFDRRVGYGGVRSEFLDQTPDDLREVGSGAKRRQFDRERIEAMEQVLPELPRFDELGERAVGRGHDLHIDGGAGAAPDRPDFPAVEEAQQSRLRGHRDVGDLVEEQRAPMRLANEPRRAVVARIGEGAAFVSEQFCDEQPLGRRAAIQGDELPGAA